MTTRKPVPVALFVFNRYAQLQETLDALKNNHIDELHIFCDGPRNKQDVTNIARVRAIIAKIDWIQPIVTIQPSNLGLSESINFGLNELFNKHESVIVIEDDICVAPDFYTYMTDALSTYAQDERIAGITGLRYPFDRQRLLASGDSAFLAPRFSSWGWGTWKRFWTQRITDRSILAPAIEASPAGLTRGGADMEATFTGYLDGSLSGSWDVACASNMLVNDQYFVWPDHNMVRNTGLLEGTHADGIAPPWELNWEAPWVGAKLPSSIKVDDMIVADFLMFFTTIQTKGDTMISKARSFGGKVKRKLLATQASPAAELNPADYSTVDEPLDVPVQKEAYYIALNNYIKDGDRVLDVGSGLGYGLNLLSIKAGEVCGVDIDERAIDYANKFVFGRNPKLKELKVYDGYNLPYKDNSFDVITTVDVLEHVEDYDRYVEELLRVAKRAVLISTPNRREENTKEDGTPKNPWHLREWSREELDAILVKHAPVEWHHVNGGWDGPFTTSTTVKPDTQTLTPVLRADKRKK